LNALTPAEGFARYELASPSLLALTPALARRLDQPTEQWWPELRLNLEQELYGLRNWRLSWWQHWARLAEAILPRRYHWLIVPNTMTRGLAINQSIADPTGAQAVRVCTAGMRSGLMSSSRPWMKIKAGVKNFITDRAAELWFEEVTDRIYRVMAGSNFYESGTQMFEDLIVFGTAVILIYEDKEDVIRCYVPCAGEYFLGAGSDFRVNRFKRYFTLTTLQLVQMFGLENVGPEVAGLWENKGASLDTENVVAHSIDPNFSLQRPGEDKDLGRIPGNFTYREYYWLWNKWTPRPLSMRGFRTAPFVPFRWATTSNDAYGRSPGMDALPDVVQLHRMTRRQAEAIEKLVRPPLLADAALKNQPSSILPGKVTYVADVNKGMKSIYEMNLDIEHMTQLIEKIEARVGKWFFNDLFEMMEQLEGVQPRNELEIMERRGEKLQRLGPIVENAERSLAQVIKRIYAIMGRRGLLPSKPQSLLGVPLDIEFDSMIAVAQRAAVTAVMERTASVIMNFEKQVQDPINRPIDNLNVDKFLKKYADRENFPLDVLNSEDERKAIRDLRQKQMQAMQQKQDAATAATHAAPALAGAAKDASETDVGGGLNALQIMGGLGGAAERTGLMQ
jgi:hypothetical protein